ncbi:hypothetical protein ACFVS2_20555 [Brevibacillus sp. NPDC058079]|uniref:hypothetical protein n=1 Tax=Brevibacillus sp. NPDC058079 TaxID=3346330 RepID=UPI0036E7C658
MIASNREKNWYGNMTEEEIALVYNGKGNYKGWKCVEVGCGLVAMSNGSEVIKAYRGMEVKSWVPECWTELKQKIDEITQSS